MNRLEELIQELCPDGVKYKKLKTVADVYDGTHTTPRYTNSGIPFVSVENITAPYLTRTFPTSLTIQIARF